jgi:hypothetical protein
MPDPSNAAQSRPMARATLLDRQPVEPRLFAKSLASIYTNRGR